MAEIKERTEGVENQENTESMNVNYKRIDHIAIAVENLESAMAYYKKTLGFSVAECRVTEGKKTSMVSAVMSNGGVTVVLVQGLQADSQVSRFIQKYGPGVQHVAFEVDDLEQTKAILDKRNTEFTTSIIKGAGVRQIFTKRDPDSQVMFEFIERDDKYGFEDSNVNNLFLQLEASESY